MDICCLPHLIRPVTEWKISLYLLNMTCKRLFPAVLASTEDKWAWWNDGDAFASSLLGELWRLQSVSQYGVLCHLYSQVACLAVHCLALVVASSVLLRCFARICFCSQGENDSAVEWRFEGR